VTAYETAICPVWVKSSLRDGGARLMTAARGRQVSAQELPFIDSR